jgi:hypothetical protein
MGDGTPVAGRFGVGVVADGSVTQPAPLAHDAHDTDPRHPDALQDEPRVRDLAALADEHLLGPHAGVALPEKLRVSVDAEIPGHAPRPTLNRYTYSSLRLHAGTLKQLTSRYISMSGTAFTGRATE